MYTVGEKVVHPMHGAGVIAEITEERLSGALARYYVFTAPLSGLTLKIPVDNSGAWVCGSRSAASSSPRCCPPCARRRRT